VRTAPFYFAQANFHARTLGRLDAPTQGEHEAKQLLSVEILASHANPFVVRALARIRTA